MTTLDPEFDRILKQQEAEMKAPRNVNSEPSELTEYLASLSPEQRADVFNGLMSRKANSKNPLNDRQQDTLSDSRQSMRPYPLDSGIMF